MGPMASGINVQECLAEADDEKHHHRSLEYSFPSASLATFFQASAISFKIIRSSAVLACLARRSHFTANSKYRTDVSMWGNLLKGPPITPTVGAAVSPPFSTQAHVWRLSSADTERLSL